MTVSFNSQITTSKSSLTFYLTRYTMNGTFVGYEVLKTQMNLCPFTYDKQRYVFEFGSVTQNVC